MVGPSRSSHNQSRSVPSKLGEGRKLGMSGKDPDNLEQNLSHQQAVLKVLLSLAVPAGILFSLINYFRGIHILALAELLFTVASLVLITRVHSIKRPRLVVACFAIPIFAIVSYAIYMPAASVTMFAWVYVIPVLAYSGLGERQGFYISLAFYLSVGTQYIIRFGDNAEFQDPAAVLNVIVCSLAIWGFVHANEKARNDSQAMLSNLAVTDPLTGLNNRLELESIFERRKEISDEEGLAMGLIMVDLDLFKLVNDTYGHDRGDEVLKRVAQSLKQSVREEDVVFRMGGEEFCLVVPRMGRAQLLKTAEAIRERVQSISFDFNGERVIVTCSVGAVIMGEQFSDLEGMLVEADRRLYRAKENGRNQVVFEQASESLSA